MPVAIFTFESPIGLSHFVTSHIDMAGRECIRSKTCMLGMQSLDANFGSRFWILKVSLHPPLPSALRGDGDRVHVRVHILPDPLGWFGIGKLRVKG